VVTLPGGHHFGGNYERIADALLAEIATRNTRPTVR
jgi:type IV secretory pathway VirJ component